MRLELRWWQRLKYLDWSDVVFWGLMGLILGLAAFLIIATSLVLTGVIPESGKAERDQCLALGYPEVRFGAETYCLRKGSGGRDELLPLPKAP